MLTRSQLVLLGGILASVLVSIFSNSIDPYYLRVIIIVGINIILAVSLNLISGITGQFSLGHAGFMAVGAYTGGILMKHFDPVGWQVPSLFVCLTFLGGLTAAGTGILIGIPTLRLRGDYLAIATLGFGEIIRVILNQIDHIGSFDVGGSAGLHGIPHVTNIFWT